LNDFFTENNFRGIEMCAFGVVGKILMIELLNGTCLVRFGFRMNVRDIDF
jgi:hypothetical protein